MYDSLACCALVKDDRERKRDRNTRTCHSPRVRGNGTRFGDRYRAIINHMVHRRRWSDIATRLQSFFLFGAEQTARSQLQSMWSSRPCFIYKIKCHFNRHVVFSESLIDPLLIDQSKPARVTIEHRQRTLYTSTRIQPRSLPGNDLAKQSPSEISSRWVGQQCERDSTSSYVTRFATRGVKIAKWSLYSPPIMDKKMVSLVNFSYQCLGMYKSQEAGSIHFAVSRYYVYALNSGKTQRWTMNVGLASCAPVLLCSFARETSNMASFSVYSPYRRYSVTRRCKIKC